MNVANQEHVDVFKDGTNAFEVSPLLWSSEILDYTIPEGEPKYAEKDVYAGV
jgi:hypothetical protein